MVVKMMRWRPWPPLTTKKFEVKLVVRRIEGVDVVVEEDVEVEKQRMMVEIRWKGGKNALSSLRRTVKRNFTKEEEVRRGDGDDGYGVVEWNEEFHSICNLSAYKDNNSLFLPWEIACSVLNVTNQGAKNKVPVVGTALLNIAEFASRAEEKEIELSIPLSVPGNANMPLPSLCLSFSLLELRTTQEPSETVQRPMVTSPLSPRQVDAAVSTEKDDLSAIKAGLRKVKILTEYVSTRRAKKACREEEDSEGRFSARSEDAEYRYPFDSESPDDFDDSELEGEKDDSTVRKSFSYGTLAHANHTGGSFYSDMRINGEGEDWVYYSNRRSDVGCVNAEDMAAPVSEHSLLQSSKRSILSWRKRKLSFRSPKAKGEPLLKKAYAEDGGDDIDFDRRQLNSDDSLSLGWHKGDEGSSTNRSSVSDFGDDNFAVGSWEHKEVISRDGHMKVSAQVFFASIDQRSERAAGESACTALVAVIADWFQTNHDTMPIKSQLDTLIRDGSLEWRNLCENETYRERFPDKHFDLETVLQAKIRPLTVCPEKSFIGFFHPDGMEEGGFDFLQGAMSFDSIWDEISQQARSHGSSSPHVYIVSWNDHFFILKVESDAYYIIDTLGERLHEGCNQAYILKFDRDTTIYKLPVDEKPSHNQQIVAVPAENGDQTRNGSNNNKETPATGLVMVMPKTGESGICEEEEEVVCKGKESCKEYIKNFLAAIPIRELQADIKKGLLDSTPLHHRLQIEFHYTNFLQPTPKHEAVEVAAVGTSVTEAAVLEANEEQHC